MPTISIPYFNLTESESSGNRSNGIWNEIRVPFSPDASSAGQRDRYSSASPGKTLPKVSLPASKPEILLPTNSPASVETQTAKPSAHASQPNQFPPTNLERVWGADQAQLGVRMAMAGNAVAQQPTQAITRLTDCILERFPIAGPTIILFAGTQSNPLTSATCANVASSLARKNVGKILLVDSCQHRELTQSYQTAELRGLSNLLSDHSDWRSSVVKLASSGLEFLPSGTSHWEHWGAENKLRQLAADMRRQYQFVCVAVDDPQFPNSKIWSGICDGSFLLVSQKNANPAIAESTVVEMQSNGARLLGCVVTDADSALP